LNNYGVRIGIDFKAPGYRTIQTNIDMIISINDNKENISNINFQNLIGNVQQQSDIESKFKDVNKELMIDSD
jgi:hypothetical protein